MSSNYLQPWETVHTLDNVEVEFNKRVRDRVAPKVADKVSEGKSVRQLAVEECLAMQKEYDAKASQLLESVFSSSRTKS